MEESSKNVAEKIRKSLLIAALACLAFGTIIIGIPPLSIIEFALGGFILYLRSQELKKIYSYKKTLTIVAIILLVFNQLAAILLLIAIDSLEDFMKANLSQAPPSNDIKKSETVNITELASTSDKNLSKLEVDKELKKIDILLKLGLAMVAISGLLFATTSWDLITDSLKVIALIMMGVLFLLASKFSETKLHIENTTFAYWILSMLFFIFSMIAIGTLAIFGSYLSYTGDGKSLLYALTYTLISVLSYSTYNKKHHNIFLYIMYFSAFIVLYNFLRFFSLSRLLIISFITIIIILINITKQEKILNLYKFSKAISYPIALLTIFISKEGLLVNLLACILNITNINYLAKEEKDSNDALIIANITISYALLTKMITFFELGIYNTPIIITIYTVFNLIINHSKISDDSLYKMTNQILYYIFTIFYFLSSLDESLEMTIISSIIILFSNLLNIYLNKEDIINTYVQPLPILLLVTSLTNYINKEIEIKCISVIAILALIYTLIYHCVKNEKTKKIYYYISIISLVISLITAYESLEKLTALIVVVGFTYHYLIETEKKKKTITYIALLISIYITIIPISLLSLPTTYNALITLWIYILIEFFQQEENHFKSITSIAIAIPSYTIISNLVISYEYQAILNTTLSLYILYLIIKLFIRNKNTKKIFSIIAISLLLLNILETNLIIGIYIGIIGLIVIMIGYYNKEYKDLFITGIAITIINILYQLQDLWSKIPFWLYLLITGLGLIIFVTYKELKKAQPNQMVQTEQRTDKYKLSDKFQINELESTKKNERLGSKD